MTKEGIMLVMLWPLALDSNGLIVNFFLFNGESHKISQRHRKQGAEISGQELTAPRKHSTLIGSLRQTVWSLLFGTTGEVS